MKPIGHSAQIEAHLKTVRQRIRKVQKSRAIIVIATVALGGLMAMMAMDFLFSPLPMGVRCSMLGVWLVAVATAARFGFAPLLKPISLIQVARWLEGRHLEMEERLSTVLELKNEHDGVSPELLESLGRLAEMDMSKVDAAVEVKTARTSWRWMRPAMVLLGMLAVAFVLWPSEASRLLVRAIAPFSALGNTGAGKFKVTPGSLEVFSGDPVRITVTYNGSHPALDIWMEMEDGKKISQAMTLTDGKFVYLLDPARAGFRYQIHAGRDVSDRFTVVVWPKPEMLDPLATLDFPKYTGQLPKEYSPANGIKAVVGTRVTLSGRTNTAIESAWLEVGGKRVSDGSIENSANGGRVGFTWMLEKQGSGEVVVKLRHRLGREIEALKFPVEVLDDNVPLVTLLSPIQRDFRIRQDEVLSLKYEVAEDFSVAKLSVEVDAGGNAKALLDETLPLQIPRSKPPMFRGEAPVSIGGHQSRFPGANEIRVRIRAEDGRPANLGGPGTGFSEWIVLHVDQGAESLARQQLRQEDEGAKKTVEEAMRTTRDGRDKMDRHRNEIRNPKMSENARKDLKKSAEQLAEAEAKLNELAKQMKDSVHAKQADEVEKAAQMATKAREVLENSLLQDDPKQRESKLDQARNDAQQSEKQLEEIRNAMERDHQKIEDLTRLMELAQKQQEVARKAEENIAKQEPAAAMPDNWKNEQRQVEEQIKQQLRERPEGRAEVLQAQADQAKKLAGEARETAQAQQELEQQTKEASPEALKKALAGEQEKGDSAEAMKKLQAAQAHAAKEFAREIETMPQLDGSGAMQDAKNIGQQGSQQATEAAKKGQEGQLAEASKQHGESQKSFERTAQALDRAAQEFGQAAQQAPPQTPNPQKVQTSPAAMAEAFQQASQAASNPQANQAAVQAANAAKALSKVAEAGRQAMQGKGPGQNQPPQPGAPPENPAGTQSGDGQHNPEPDLGIPPELAKLGISSDDWAKIRASLKSDVGAGESDAVPEEYRGLVKSYFESMSKKANKE